MGRLRRCILALVCVCLLTTAVFAESSAVSVDNQCTVNADGYCDVTLNVTVNLEQPASNFSFPLPKDARNVTVNGQSVNTRPSPIDPNAILADLSSMDGAMGSYIMTFRYGLPNVLKTVENEKTKEYKLYMELPLLCGFDYPVETMSFRITMPGEVSGKPNFSSVYLQNGIETIVDCLVGGSLISGTVTQPLAERETVTMTMAVEETMFPGKLVLPREGNPEARFMAICAAAAALYWLLLLRSLPPVRIRQTTLLDGITAGELGCRLTMAGVDLTMMVLSWGRLGYLQIVPDSYGRVMLYKRMDMGNERTEFENRCFRQLFAKSDRADATGMAYARLCRDVAGTVAGAKEMHRRQSGSTRIFRAIASLVSLFSGICLAMNLPMGVSALQIMLAVVFAALGVVTAWGIQGGMYRFHVRGKIPLLISLICMVVWLLLGILSGQVMIALWAVLAQLLAGLAAAYGGRRSDLGRYQAGQILGLRHYLKNMPREEILRNMRNDPYYFFDMLPYAIALGVDGRFARQFGKMRLPSCGYLVPRQSRQRTGAEWAQLLHKTADRMDSLQRRLELGQWVPVLPKARPTRRPPAKAPKKRKR